MGKHLNTYRQSLDDMEVWNINFRVLGCKEILLCHKHTLLEQVFIDGHAVSLWDQHPAIANQTHTQPG